MTDTGAAVATSLQRAGIYRVLASAFAYPTTPRIEELARASSTLAIGLAAGPVRDAVAALSAAAYVADAPALAGEYVFLFDRQVQCPPWESAWGAAPLMAGKAPALADIAGFYTAFGLEPSGGQPDMEDHIVPELEFMSALALKEAWARGESDTQGIEVLRSAARAFLTDHLGCWAESFAAELEAATPVAFYVAAARALAAWLAADVATVGATPIKLDRRAGADPLQAESFSCPMAADATEFMEGPEVLPHTPPRSAPSREGCADAPVVRGRTRQSRGAPRSPDSFTGSESVEVEPTV